MSILLRHSNPNFQPNRAGHFIEQYISEVRSKLKKLSNLLAFQQQHINQSRIAIIAQEIANNINIIIVDSDKNQGPCRLDRQDYEQECFRILSDITTYRQLFSPDSRRFDPRAHSYPSPTFQSCDIKPKEISTTRSVGPPPACSVLHSDQSIETTDSWSTNIVQHWLCHVQRFKIC
jgi:hypothetical protein